MSFLKTIQLFVANNPGLTNKEIAAALSGGDKARVNAVEWLKKQGVTV